MITKSVGFNVFHCAAIDVISILPALPAWKGMKRHKSTESAKKNAVPEAEDVTYLSRLDHSCLL